MRSAIVLEGPPADWEAHRDVSERVVNGEGSPNMGAALQADPGCMKCPHCGEHLWREGWRVRCPECSHEFETGLRLNGATRAFEEAWDR